MGTDFIRIFDTTLRDGEQSPGCSMNLNEKLTLARQLERLGVDVIEAGFPIASEGDFESVRAIAQELKKATVAGLSRTSPEDVERAGRALEGAAHSRIHTFIATSDIHLQHKLRMGREDVLSAATDIARSNAVAAGARADSLKVVEMEDLPLAYLPGNSVRARVRVVGEVQAL